MNRDALKIITKDGICYAIFPRDQIHCLILGDQLAVNEFMSKSIFMTRGHGYIIDLEFTDIREFMDCCNRSDLGITVTEELNDEDELNVAIYLA